MSSDYIISLVNGMLATIQAAKLPQVTVKVKAFGFTIASATYTMSITDAHSSWSSGTSASVSGVFGGLAQGQVQNTVTSTLNSELTTALTKLGPQLQALADQKQNLVDQLPTLDPLAGAKLEAAESTATD